ncbi:MAG TPA: hypothetical protein VFG19_05045 [Geobacteraceae bacterium]|nr:hypothetical protein [Geobacteraceae bacterium]
MSYQLSTYDVIKALSFEPWLILIGVITIAAIAMYKAGVIGRHWPVLLIVAIFVFGVFRCSIQECVGDGWRLEGNKLTFKAWEEHAIIDLSATRITLADTVGPWQPVRSTYRYGTPGLTAGWFTLQNGEKAVIFYHRKPTKMLVLFYDNRIFILAHPGVERLYHELIALGVREQGGIERAPGIAK